MFSVSVRSTRGINMGGSQAETLTSTAILFIGGSEIVPNLFFSIEKEKSKAQLNGRQIIPGGNRSKSERLGLSLMFLASSFVCCLRKMQKNRKFYYKWNETSVSQALNWLCWDLYTEPNFWVVKNINEHIQIVLVAAPWMHEGISWMTGASLCSS